MTYTIRTRGAVDQPKVAEYECPECGTFEVTLPGPPDETDCPTCGETSAWTISRAPIGKVKAVSVQRGKSDERPPWALNTEALADGMPMKEWKALQDKKDRDWRRKKNREALK